MVYISSKSLDIVSTDGSIDRICIDKVTDRGAGATSLEGLTLQLFTVVCVVIRGGGDGGVLEFSFADGATCDLVNFGHQIETWHFVSRQSTPVCPFMPLLGLELSGWGTYNATTTYVGFTEGGYFYSPIEYTDWTITLCAQAGVRSVPGTSPPALELKVVPGNTQCNQLYYGCCIWIWVDPSPAGYFAYNMNPLLCPEDETNVVTLSPWNEGDPSGLLPTPLSTVTSTPTSSASTGFTYSSTRTPTRSRTPSRTPSRSVSASVAPSPDAASGNASVYIGLGASAAVLAFFGAAAVLYRRRRSRYATSAGGGVGLVFAQPGIAGGEEESSLLAGEHTDSAAAERGGYGGVGTSQRNSSSSSYAPRTLKSQAVPAKEKEVFYF